MLLILSLLACVKQDGRPDLGDCAVYPDGAYTYGEIGIGTCLAGPNALRFAGDPDDPSLLVLNSNPYLNFTGGSLLSLRWSDLDRDAGRNLVTDLDPVAVDLPSFGAGLDVDDQGLAMVPVRLSEDSRTRAWYDQLWLVDLSDPANPALSDAGTDGASSIEVQSDPIAAAHDASTGLGFVGNRTSHSVSVVDLNADPVEVLLPWPDQALRQSPFVDADASGSRAELTDVEAVASTDDVESELADDLWTFSWVEGSYRLWVPANGGVQRYTTTGEGYLESAMGTELSVEDADGAWAEVQDPAYQTLLDATRMYFVDQGVVVSADQDDFLGDWVINDEIALEGKEGAWDETVGGPEVVLDSSYNYWMYYDGTDGEGWGIGGATSTDGLTFRRLGAPLIEPTWAHEAERISDPYVVFDAETDRWRMYYSAYDGENWTLGHAISYDLETWETDDEPVFSLADEGVGVAAPVISISSGLFRMWYARLEAGRWWLAAAESPDGDVWTDLGVVAELDHNPALGDEPPGPALLATPFDGFSVEGAATGRLVAPVVPGVTYESATFGWSAVALAGYQLSPLDVGSPGWGGVSVDSLDWDAGLAWLSLTSRDGDRSVGVATLDADGRLTASRALALEPGDPLSPDGVSSPVVIALNGGYTMYYAATDGDITSIGVATSTDGLSFTPVGAALELVDEAWDGAGMSPGSATVLDDGSIRLWYTGTNGDLLRIGSAISTDGLTFTREEPSENKPWAFPPGSPGDWDDSGVRDPYVVRTDDGEHLFYAGTDGDTWRIGHAFRASEDEAWTRAADPVSDEPRPVLGHVVGLFHQDGTLRPVARWDGVDWSVWFAGYDGEVSRVGLAVGEDPERLHERPLRPTVGDTLLLATEGGDPDATAIPLDSTLDGRTVTGEALAAMAYDQARGMLYIASTHTNYILVVDGRDDSADGAPDTNYLDLEAVLTYDTSPGGAGFRSLVVDGDRLYAANDAPESVVVFDLTRIEDDAKGDAITDAVIGALVANRGAGGDEGVPTAASVGPGGMALHPDGRRLFVAGFNSNSLTVYDLSLGSLGSVIADIDDIGEMPYAVAISPDGLTAVVANYAGEVSDLGETNATLAIVDIDEQSPTYLEVLSWVVNR